MWEQKIMIIFTLQTFVFLLCGQLLDKKAIKITWLETRCRKGNDPVAVYLKGIKCDTRSVFIENSTVVVKENLMNNLQSNITVHRCQTRENLDTCELYKRGNANYCRLINPDNVMVARSPLAVHYTPKLKCPIKKGVYHAYNFTVNLTPFVVVAIDGWYWKIEFNIYSPDGSRLIGCTHIEGYTVLRSTD